PSRRWPRRTAGRPGRRWRSARSGAGASSSPQDGPAGAGAPSIGRRKLSRMRQPTDDDLLARSFSVTMPGGAFALPTEPGWHQLVHASTGSMRVETGGALGPGRAELRVLPPHRALWLPDGWRAR